MIFFKDYWSPNGFYLKNSIFIVQVIKNQLVKAESKILHNIKSFSSVATL